jgi:predicted membrane protein
MKSNQISDESTALIGNMKLNVEKISKFNFAVRKDDSELQENKRRLKFKTS